MRRRVATNAVYSVVHREAIADYASALRPVGRYYMALSSMLDRTPASQAGKIGSSPVRVTIALGGAFSIHPFTPTQNEDAGR